MEPRPPHDRPIKRLSIDHLTNKSDKIKPEAIKKNLDNHSTSLESWLAQNQPTTAPTIKMTDLSIPVLN
ncbi:MAG: hypothetical protein HamCj_21240 [Candidatus Hamiltonella defensa (Ceratovacuna japonica)]